jgi:hypothetical protein
MTGRKPTINMMADTKMAFIKEVDKVLSPSIYHIIVPFNDFDNTFTVHDGAIQNGRRGPVCPFLPSYRLFRLFFPFFEGAWSF